MTALRFLALAAGLFALVLEVWRRRDGGAFPLQVLFRDWFGASSDRTVGTAFGLFLGVGVVAGPLVVAALLGWARVVPGAGITTGWLLPAAASVLVKLALVVCEEIVSRGAVIAAGRRVVPGAAAVVGSAVVFALAHADRTLLGLAVLFLDGLGFGVAFLATGRLWMPVAWHAGKNVAIWVLYGAGTLQLAAGPFVVEFLSETFWFAPGPGATALDVVASAAALGTAVVWFRSRPPV